MKKLETLQNILGIHFMDLALLKKSLVHRSHVNETDNINVASNERLEFLGDALLGLVITEKIYQELPDLAEGDLTKIRASLVRMETLAGIAQTLDLGEYLLLGKGEDDSGGRQRPRNLARVMEAVIGAVFLDQGYSVAGQFVLNLLGDELERVMKGDLDDDSKSELQELIQAKHRVHPVYNVICIGGPDHERDFTVEVAVEEKVIGRGAGSSKRIAEQAAAKFALGHLNGEEKLD